MPRLQRNEHGVERDVRQIAWRLFIRIIAFAGVRVSGR